MKELLSKIKEALISALPITVIVYILSMTPWFDFSKAEIISFAVPLSSVIGVNLYRFLSDSR